MKNNKSILSLLAIVLSIIAIVLSLYSVISLKSYKSQSSSTQNPDNISTQHYSCKKCGYSFNDLSSLRMEISSATGIHSYLCPSCGEILTNDMKGNAIESLNEYGFVVDNWKTN